MKKAALLAASGLLLAADCVAAEPEAEQKADAAPRRMAEVPQFLADTVAPTNETRGAFVQTRRLADGKELVSRGEFAIRPGVDFVWRTTDPFDALFLATRTCYTYSNEDECVTRPLKDLKGYSRIAPMVEKRDFSAFFKTFDAMYKEEPEGVFHVLAKPKESRIKKRLERVEADGSPTNWTFRATFPDRSLLELRLLPRGLSPAVSPPGTVPNGSGTVPAAPADP